MSETEVDTGHLRLIGPIVATALFWSLEAITSGASASVYHYSFYAFMASVALLIHLESVDRSAEIARFVGIFVIFAPGVLEALTGMELLLFGLFSFLASGGLIGFSLYWRERKGKYRLAKPFLWFLLAWYVIAGVSLIPSAAITFGLPEQSFWWGIIAFYGLAGWFVRWVRILSYPMDVFAAASYGFVLYLAAYSFSPSVAVWACSTNLVVIYLRLLMPAILKILAPKRSADRLKTVLFRWVDRRTPDTIEGKRPESVAWIVEEKCEGGVFLEESHLLLLRSRDKRVIDIPIKDIVKLERGEMRRFSIDRSMETIVAYLALGLPGLVYATERVPTSKITYLTRPGVPSTVTLAAEQKLCPKCGKGMSLVAAGWYCKKDDHLIDPTTNDLVQMIESRRPQKGSKEDTHSDRFATQGKDS